MAKYEVWGTDESSKLALLAFATGDIPQPGDSILVRGEVREISKVWRHHVGPQATQRIKVKPAGTGDDDLSAMG